MTIAANKKIALALLGAPVLTAIGIGLAAPAFAASERVEPSEPSEVSEAGLPTMPSEHQEQAATPPSIALPKPANDASLAECTTHEVDIRAFC
jgi:hypothetical protein